MKKSTQFILIGLGSILIIASALIYIFAFRIKAETLKTPAPEVSIPEGEGEIKLTGFLMTQDGDWAASLSWEKKTPAILNPIVAVNLVRSWDKDRQKLVGPPIDLSKIATFPTGTYTDKITRPYEIKPGQSIYYTLIIGYSNGLRQASNWLKLTRPSDQNYDPSNPLGPPPESGGGGNLPPSQASGDETSDCGCGILNPVAPMGYVTCYVKCEVLKGAGWFINWGLNLMQKWSGIKEVNTPNPNPT